MSKSAVPRLELFKKLANFDTSTNQSRIVHVSDFVGDYVELKFENGASWCRKQALKGHIMARMYSNGELYLNIDDPELEKKVKAEMMEYMNENYPNHIYKSKKTMLLKICGVKERYIPRPIHPSIYQAFENSRCCHCSSKNHMVVDHKNDLYNDPRVLNTKTQTIDDFQPLCNSCNLKKRGYSRKMRETGKRIPASEIIFGWAKGVDFIAGDETFNPDDPNALVGYYWYDVEGFKEYLFQMEYKKGYEKGYEKGYTSAVNTEFMKCKMRRTIDTAN